MESHHHGRANERREGVELPPGEDARHLPSQRSLDPNFRPDLFATQHLYLNPIGTQSLFLSTGATSQKYDFAIETIVIKRPRTVEL